MNNCYIALGANLGQPRQQLESALEAIDALPECHLLARSPWYRSRAVGPGPQPDYLNGVALIGTALEPLPLLQALLAIETDHGRRRGERWAARVLDLDILLYENQVIDLPGLHIPHPRMGERDFVLRPLLDIAPALALPCGTPVGSLLGGCPDTGLRVDLDEGRAIVPPPTLRGPPGHGATGETSDSIARH